MHMNGFALSSDYKRLRINEKTITAASNLFKDRKKQQKIVEEIYGGKKRMKDGKIIQKIDRPCCHP